MADRDIRVQIPTSRPAHLTHRRAPSDPFEFDEPCFASPNALQAASVSWGWPMSPAEMSHKVSPGARSPDTDEETSKLGSAVSSIQLRDAADKFGTEDTQNWGRVDAWVGDGSILPGMPGSSGGASSSSWDMLGDTTDWGGQPMQGTIDAEQGIVPQPGSQGVPVDLSPQLSPSSPVFEASSWTQDSGDSFIPPSTSPPLPPAPTTDVEAAASTATSISAPTWSPAPELLPSPTSKASSIPRPFGREKRARPSGGSVQSGSPCRVTKSLRTKATGGTKVLVAPASSLGGAPSRSGGQSPAPTRAPPAVVSDGEDAARPPPLMEKPLPAEIAYRMLIDKKFSPGNRPPTFRGHDGRWVFKEKAGARAPACRGNRQIDCADRADRWHNSGGIRGARDMPAEMPLVRRRYGSVSRDGQIMYRFHEYSLIANVGNGDDGAQAASSDKSKAKVVAASDDGGAAEDRSTIVFHVMPKRSGRGRPSKAEAALPEQLWLNFLGDKKAN